MVHLGEPVLDVVPLTHTIKDVRAVPDVLLGSGELDTIVGQDRVDAVRDSLDQIKQELGCFHSVCPRRARMMASSSAVSTVERTSFDPILASAVLERLRHF
jgi:hypothetical protein